MKLSEYRKGLKVRLQNIGNANKWTKEIGTTVSENPIEKGGKYWVEVEYDSCKRPQQKFLGRLIIVEQQSQEVA